MSIKLTIVKRATVNSFEEVVAIGSVELDAALKWLDEIFAAASIIDRIESHFGLFDLKSDTMLRPAGNNLLHYEPQMGMLMHYEYQFTGVEDDLEQLIDKFSALHGERELASA